MRAVAYARVSTDSDEQVHSLNTQIKFFDDYFKENGYEKGKSGILWRRNGKHELLEGIYADEGITGTSTKRREAFKQLMQDAKAGKFDLIVTKSLARFGRNVVDVAKHVKDLKELNIAVLFLDTNINSLDNSREFELGLFALLAQEESRHKSDIVQFGIRRAQKEGKWISTTPFGYNKVDGFLEVNESEAAVVRMIFDMYCNQGYGTGKIARQLNAERILTKKGVMWSQTQVVSILENQLYIGKQVTHTVMTVDINRQLQRSVPENEQFVHVKPQLQIIADEVFQRTQTVRLERRAMREADTPHRYSNKHLFSNILYCRNCGSALKRKKRRPFGGSADTAKDLGYEWCCRIHDMYGAVRCKYRNAHSEEYLLEFIKSEILKYRSNRSGLQWNLDQYLKVYFDSENVDDKITALDEQIRTVKHHMDINFSLVADGKQSPDQFKERNDRLESQLNELTSNKNSLLFREQEISTVLQRYRDFEKYLEEIDVDHLTNETLRQLISAVWMYTFDDNMAEFLGVRTTIEIEWTFLGVTQDELIQDMAFIDGVSGNVDDTIDYDNDPDVVFDPRQVHLQYRERSQRVRNRST